MTITYRSLETIKEIEETASIYGTIWSADEREIIPPHLLIAIQHAGGLLLGAFDNGQMIGATVSFVGIRGETLLHWSHITGVVPGYQGRGVGSGLKWLQRQLVLEQGLDCVAWTFDPLQRGNARFNIRRLGCVCNQYHVNIYGQLDDELNAGLPTDRFEVRWWLKSDRVQRRTHTLPPEPDTHNLHRTLRRLPDGSPGEILWPGGHEPTIVEIPDDINRLRNERLDVAMSWREHTRQVFTRLFAEGYTVVDFVSQNTDDGQPGYGYLLKYGETD